MPETELNVAANMALTAGRIPGGYGWIFRSGESISRRNGAISLFRGALSGEVVAARGLTNIELRQ